MNGFSQKTQTIPEGEKKKGPLSETFSVSDKVPEEDAFGPLHPYAATFGIKDKNPKAKNWSFKITQMVVKKENGVPSQRR